MRIAIFTNTYHPTLNGVANCVEAYRTGLEDLGHEVSILAPCPNGYDTDQDDDRIWRFPAMPLPGQWDYDIALPYSKPVLTTLKEIDFDLVHTQHPVWVGAWGQWFAEWSGIPLVTTVHTEYEVYNQVIPLPDGLVDAYLKTRVTRYCNECDLVTTPVQSAAKRLKAQGVMTPIEILHNPIDLSAIGEPQPDGVRSRYHIADNEFLMGFLGRLAPEKDLPVVLNAASIVMQNLPDSKFLMIGDGPELSGLKTHVRKLGIEDRVVFAGFVEHDQVCHYQAALDVFVTASMSETQPLAYTEAMAVGTPVVAVKAPGAQDMFDHGTNALLSSPDDKASGLANQILKLHDNKELRHAIIDNARRRVQEYDVSAVTEHLARLYHHNINLHAQQQ